MDEISSGLCPVGSSSMVLNLLPQSYSTYVEKIAVRTMNQFWENSKFHFSFM